MAVCPATRKPCIDDLCYGNGCMRREARGEQLLVECDGCGKLIAMDGSDADECECEPPEYDEDPGYREATGSCEDCGTNLYGDESYEGTCDQCSWARSQG